MDRGKIVGWYLYAINFTGANDEYNYVTINLYNSLDSLENPWDPDIPSLVHPDQPISQILQKTRNARVQVRSELYYPIINLPEGTPLIPSAYLLVAAYGHLGRREEARAMIAKLLELKPDYARSAGLDWLKFNIPVEDVDRFRDGLRKAGLDFPDEPPVAD